MSGKSLKVVVEINEAYPLLHSAFARIPANVRSERLSRLLKYSPASEPVQRL